MALDRKAALNKIKKILSDNLNNNDSKYNITNKEFVDLGNKDLKEKCKLFLGSFVESEKARIILSDPSIENVDGLLDELAIGFLEEREKQFPNHFEKHGYDVLINNKKSILRSKKLVKIDIKRQNNSEKPRVVNNKPMDPQYVTREQMSNNRREYKSSGVYDYRDPQYVTRKEIQREWKENGEKIYDQSSVVFKQNENNDSEYRTLEEMKGEKDNQKIYDQPSFVLNPQEYSSMKAVSKKEKENPKRKAPSQEETQNTSSRKP